MDIWALIGVVMEGRNGLPLLLAVIYSVVAHVSCYKLIHNTKDMFIRASMFGKDLNKTSEEKIPEGLGVVSGAMFLISCFLFIPIPFLDYSELQFTFFICALLSICCMIFLGFADDVFDLRWRHKLFLPTIASLPLLMVYYVSGGSTTIIVPIPFRSLLGYDLNLGILVYIYMGMLAVFCTNAINILAGINGVEVGQSVTIAISIAIFNFIELTGPFADKHRFSLYLILPFIGVSLALLRHNWYPSQVFVGDTYCYFSGMTFAVVAILGSFSKTMLLFFIPQVFNFLYSVPQLFRIVPCPRHRLPKFNKSTGLLDMSCVQFPPDQLGPGGKLFLMIVDMFGLAHVEWSVGKKNDEIRVNNLTIINFLLKFIGPTHERTLTIYMLLIQMLGTVIAFSIRYGFVRFFYDIVQ